MTVRTREATIPFDYPFHLRDAVGVLSAGAYRVTRDEEQSLGISFVAYRRVAKMLHAPPSRRGGAEADLSVTVTGLDAALRRDW